MKKEDIWKIDGLLSNLREKIVSEKQGFFCFAYFESEPPTSLKLSGYKQSSNFGVVNISPVESAKPMAYLMKNYFKSILSQAPEISRKDIEAFLLSEILRHLNDPNFEEEIDSFEEKTFV